MAPTSSPALAHSPNHLSGGHFHRLHRQGLSSPHRPPMQLLGPRAEQPKARTPDAASQPLVVPESPPPPSTVSVLPPQSLAFGPKPSAINKQPPALGQPVDITGNVLAAVVLIVLILGGLVGLVVGGERLRRRARARGKGAYPPRSRCLGRRKSVPTKSIAGSPQQRLQTNLEKFPYDETTLAPLARPPPVLDMERHRRPSDVWPIYNPLPCPTQVELSLRQSPSTANPQATWCDFTPVSPLYVPLPRTVLTCIPEELEECQSQTNSSLENMLGITFQQFESGLVASEMNQAKSSQNMLLNGSDSSGSSRAAERRTQGDARDEDGGWIDISAPDMTFDEGESSRSSTASLESLEVGNESLREEGFELRRAQTRSMQMNKGVLLSLSFKTLDGFQSSESTHGGCGPAQRTASVPDADGGKESQYSESEPSLAMPGENYNAVDVDEFSSLPSVLPMIPSFVSGW